MICTGCGKCCSSILPISSEEKKNILDYIDKNGIKCYNYNEGQNVFNVEYKDICPFLNPRTHRCNIYEVRPEVCQHYNCKERSLDFEHNGKRIMNFYEEFYPEVNILYKPNTKELDEIYQEKKRKAGLK